MTLTRAADDGDDDRLHPLKVPRLHGLGHAERALLDAYRSNRLHHAWLIGGAEGIGKATLAWHFARFLLANPDPTTSAVGTAETLEIPSGSTVTQRLLAGGHGDLVVLERQWNDKTKKPFSDIRVDDVRHALGLFQRASGSGGFRICIIDSAEDLNRSSANALLKIIEEPPPRSLFLIVAHRPGQVLPTLVSRARRLMLPVHGDVDVAAAVRGHGGNWATIEDARLTTAACRGRGSVGAAMRFLKGEAFDIDAATGSLLERLPEVDWRRVHRIADTVGMSDDRFGIVLRAVLDWLEARAHVEARSSDAARASMRVADAWESIRAAAREAEALNLDKRPLLLSIFADLARAAA